MCCPEILRNLRTANSGQVFIDLRTVLLDICKLLGDARTDFRTLKFSGQDRVKEGERGGDSSYRAQSASNLRTAIYLVNLRTLP